MIKRIFPETLITMADINKRAVDLAAENAVRNHVKFADIRVSDAFAEVEGTFDIILTNPPVRAGKKTVFRFYEESYDRLTADGILYVVIQRKQGAPSSSEKLESLFGNCTVAAKSAGYRVLKCSKV
ncbi:MAG: class I SAM-dependent methyltransferase [Saccharofermentanales bacterium]